MAEVKIGESTATISRLNGYKAAEAMAIVSEITEGAPGLLKELAEFTHRYGLEHAQRMPRATAEAKFPNQAKNVSEAAWKASGNELVVPEPPGIEEQIMFALPKVYKQARESLIDLLSLLLATNRELEEADSEGKELYGKDGALAEQRRRLLHEAELEQLVAVAVAAGETLREQLQSIDGGQLGKLLAVFGINRETTTSPPPAPAESEPTGSAPASASPSAEQSAGTAETSSTESPSARSAPAPVS